MTGNTVTLTGHGDDVNSFAFSPDGKRVATASGDATVKLWDLATGQETMTLKGHDGPVVKVVFSPNGQQLASFGGDRTVILWDATPLSNGKATARTPASIAKPRDITSKRAITKPEPDNRPSAATEMDARMHRVPSPFHDVAAIECEQLRIVAKSPNLRAEVQSLTNEWSGGAHLLVFGQQIGDFVELAIPSSQPGPHKLTLYATKSWDFGVLRFSVDGQIAGNYDAFNSTVVPSGPIELGVFEPKNHQYVLRVEVVAANPASTNTKSYFGLDAIALSELQPSEDSGPTAKDAEDIKNPAKGPTVTPPSTAPHTNVPSGVPQKSRSSPE
jgi:hypothetical protein